MDCAGNEVHIWRIALNPSRGELDSLLATLSHDELERADRFRTTNLRRRFIAGRGAMRCILASYLEVAPNSLKFQLNEYGKPELKFPKHRLFFNLTHSHETGLLAVTRCGRVGIDLEHTVQAIAVDELIHMTLADSEKAEIEAFSPSERISAFYSTWTRKEAFAKALGRGLSASFADFVVTSRPEGRPRLVSFPGEDASTWSVVDLQEPGAYGAVAVQARNPEIQKFEFVPRQDTSRSLFHVKGIAVI